MEGAYTTGVIMARVCLLFISTMKIYCLTYKDVQVAFGPADIRRMTAATAAVTLACLFTEMLFYVLGRLHSSYVLSTILGLHRI